MEIKGYISTPKEATSNEPQYHHSLPQDSLIPKPGLMIRYGSAIFLILFLIAAMLSWFIKYPELITTKATLTAVNAPKILIAKVGTKINRLTYKDGDTVKKGTILGYLESESDPESVLHLKEALEKLKFALFNNTEAIKSFSPEEYQHLGELQEHFQTFTKSYIEHLAYLPAGYYERKMRMLEQDLNTLEIQTHSLQDEENLLKQSIWIGERTLSMHRDLAKEKVISANELRLEESKMLDKKMGLPQLQSTIAENINGKNAKRKEIAELLNTISQQKSIFEQAINSMLSVIDNWANRFLLIAPVDGRISYTPGLQENLQVSQGQVLLYLSPPNISFFVVVNLKQPSFGKIHAGILINLKFHAYPFEEYGTVKGVIEYISDLPTDSGYYTRVRLIEGLRTTYNVTLPFKEGLTADGQLITENKTLLQHLYFKSIKGLKR